MRGNASSFRGSCPSAIRVSEWGANFDATWSPHRPSSFCHVDALSLLLPSSTLQRLIILDSLSPLPCSEKAWTWENLADAVVAATELCSRLWVRVEEGRNKSERIGRTKTEPIAIDLCGIQAARTH